MAHTIEVFSAGCPTCAGVVDMVKRLAGSEHQVHVRSMQEPETAARAATVGIRSLPAIVIDGRVAGCCAGRGPDEEVLRAALR
jgi:glutaredoxin 3